MAGQATGSRRKSTAIMLLTGHRIKLTPEDLFLFP